MGELVDRTLAAIAHQLVEHRISVDVDPSVAVRGDARGVGHVIRNLVTNAAKYSPPGTTISIAARQHGDEVTIEIGDEGIGIEPELQERIFDRFYRAASASFTARGSGVGLNIVKRYTELMDGTVRVSSSPGQGSVFTILLPAG